MPKLEQGSTQITVNSPTVQPARVQGTNFTGLIKAGRGLLERKVVDKTSSILNESIKSYQTGMDDLRATKGKELGNADIESYNKRAIQTLSQSILESGGDVKTLNSALTAFKANLESNQQFTLTQEGDILVKTDGNGNQVIKVDPKYAQKLHSRMMASLPLATQVEIENLREKNPEAASNLETTLIKQQGDIESFGRESAYSLAATNSIKHKRELTKEENYFNIAKAKNQVISTWSNTANDVLGQVKSGSLQPEVAEKVLMDSYNALVTDEGFNKTLEAYGENAYDFANATRAYFQQNVQLRIKAADPKVKLTREMVIAEAESKLFNADFINSLPTYMKRELAIAGPLKNASDAMLFIRAVDRTGLTNFIFSHEQSIRTIGELSEKGWDANATPEDFTQMMNYTRKAFANIISGYGQVDSDGKELPTVGPSTLLTLMTKSLSHPKYQEYTTDKQKKTDLALLRALKDLYSKDPKIKDYIESRTGESESDGVFSWPWE